jgi:hypothetical protein
MQVHVGFWRGLPKVVRHVVIGAALGTLLGGVMVRLRGWK